MSLALATFALLFLQAGSAPPAQQPPPQTAPAARRPGLPPTAPAPPPAPPRPMVPVAPRDPASISTLHHLISEEKSLIAEEKKVIDEANGRIQDMNSQIQGYNKIAQDEIEAVRKKENWGEEVVFNPQTEGFERPLPGQTPSAAKPAPEKKEEKK